jgi:hypothetical protein
LIDGDEKELREKFALFRHGDSVFYLLVHGGIDTLEDVLNAIQMKIPILIILVIILRTFYDFISN